MKIEKLSDDKIRITLNMEDLKENDIDFHSFMSNPIESQDLFMQVLDKAEKEVGFVTEDYRIMIEALAMANGNFVLTVTRISQEKTKNTYKPKKLNIKRKTSQLNSKKAIYCFDAFDEFLGYCKFLKNDILINIDDFSSHSRLYEYNNKYYFVLEDIKMNTSLLKTFASSITEFAHFVDNSDLFESKLLEYGNIIFKDDAISMCLKHFVKN
ncbi:MAG: adaptor protein MecA [Clostridia bacterium]|nr:adaptor protein MecA [Clostridia bacterium]